MQLQTPPRSSDFPADTLRHLRRLAILTGRYCDRIEAEKDEYTREKNYKYALRCIFRIQKALFNNEQTTRDKEARAQLGEISDALFDAWYFLADRAPGSDCNLLDTLASLAVKSVENFDLYKTSFYYTLSEIKQRAK